MQFSRVNYVNLIRQLKLIKEKNNCISKNMYLYFVLYMYLTYFMYHVHVYVLYFKHPYCSYYKVNYVVCDAIA